MARPRLPTDPERSALMRRIGRSRTAPEEAVAAILRDLGVRYRRNQRGLPGSPDFSNKSRRWAIFVHGCFWHHHRNCRKATIPKRNQDFWVEKFAANRIRDASKTKLLRDRGFKVLIVWECQVGRERMLMRRLRPLVSIG